MPTFNSVQNAFEQALRLIHALLLVVLILVFPGSDHSDTQHVKDDLPVTLLEEQVAQTWRRMLQR